MLQVVFVKWGTKYSAAYVNALVEAVLEHVSRPVKFVCFTEDADGLDNRIEARPFPDLGVPLKALTGRNGSFAKFSMFVDGELTKGMDTIYLDLDTMVVGDIAVLADCLHKRRGLYFLQRHLIPWWRMRPLLRLLGSKQFYLGNTAVMAFYPEDWLFIAEDFRRDYPDYHAGRDTLSQLRKKVFKGGNENTISEAARHASYVFPRDVAIKFTQGYMSPFLWLAKLKNALPWTRSIRERRPVLTFHGESLKPENLVEMKEGQLVSHKYHKTIWAFPEITEYWRKMLKSDQD